MNKRKNGFTLIELLAVIVILAIIALIATPIVLNIINDAKEESELRSADFYLKSLELSIAQSTLDGQNITDGTYNILENGNVCLVDLVNGKCPEDKTLVVEVKGKVPKEGTVTIANGEINEVLLKLDNKEIVKNNKGELVYQTEELVKPVIEKTLGGLATTNDFVKSVDSCANSGLCAVGTKFALRVTNVDIQNFYVIKDTGSVVTLIMDRNIGSDISWNCSDYCGREKQGPLDAIEYLEEQTSNWYNIPVFNYTYVDDTEYEDDKYEDIAKTNINSRMLTYTEAESILSNSWSYENLGDLEGYWLTRNNGCYAYAVFNDGSFKLGSDVDEEGRDMESKCYGSYNFGVRPVIEIPK